MRSIVFNTERDVQDQPRGSTHNARTMEHYRVLGLSGQVRRLGLLWDHPTGISFFTRYAGFELCRLPHPPERDLLRAVAEAPCTDQVPEPQHRANQMYVERLLVEHAATRPNITLRYGYEVCAVAPDPNGVTVHSADAERPGGVRAVTRVGYVVGCDGGRSTVRRALGIGYEGVGSIDQDILGRTAIAAHLRVPDLYAELLGHRRAWSNWAINHELALNLIALDGRDQFFLLTSSVDPATVDAGVLVNLVRRAIGRASRVDVLGFRPWKPGAALVAERFGVGACCSPVTRHLFTPNGGFGMNTGMDDAANLAWKLAAAVHGWAGPGLLASYETERRPIALRNTAAARELNVGLGAVERPAVLEDDSDDGAAARRRVGARLADYGSRTLDTLGVQLGARYDGSPIVVAGPADDPPADVFHEYHPSGVPGGRTPHVWLTDAHDGRRSLYDLLGRGFTLLRLGGHASDGGPLLAAAARTGVPVKVVDVPFDAARDLYGRDLALVRPDQHLAWRGNQLPADPDALLRTVSGG